MPTPNYTKEYVLSLPIAPVSFQGRIFEAHIDEQNGYAIEMTPSGRANAYQLSKVQIISQQPVTPLPFQSQPQQTPNQSPEQSTSSPASTHKPDVIPGIPTSYDPKKQKASKKKSSSSDKGDLISNIKSDKKKIIILAIVFVIVVLLLVLLMSVIRGLSSDPVESSASEESSSTLSSEEISSLLNDLKSSSSEEAEESSDLVHVIGLSHDLLAGSQITAEDLEEQRISQETYNNINLSGLGHLCLWEDSPAIIGQFTTEYIPADQYLLYENLSITYQGNKNPWYLEENADQYTILPVPEEMRAVGDLTVGEIITLSVSYTVLETPEVPQAESSETSEESSAEESSVDLTPIPIEKTASFDLPVCELFNQNSSSISQLETSYFNMYDVAMKTYLSKAVSSGDIVSDDLFPVSMAVSLSDDQVAVFGGSLYADGVSYTITRTTSYDTGSQEKAAFVTNMIAVSNALKSVLQ